MLSSTSFRARGLVRVYIKKKDDSDWKFHAQYDYCLMYRKWQLSPGGRGNPWNSWWECAARFSKSWHYFKPKPAIFHTHLQTWPLKSILVFRPILACESCTQFANPLPCPSEVNILFKHYFLLFSSIWHWTLFQVQNSRLNLAAYCAIMNTACTYTYHSAYGR